METPHVETRPLDAANDTGTVMDRLLETDPDLLHLGREMSRQKALLKAALTPEQWQLYADVEDTANARMWLLCDLLRAPR